MISWNVNGLRPAWERGFLEYLKESDADIFCIQESKLQGRAGGAGASGISPVLELRGKKGYSGTAMFYEGRTCLSGLRFWIEEHDHEGQG